MSSEEHSEEQIESTGNEDSTPDTSIQKNLDLESEEQVASPETAEEVALVERPDMTPFPQETSALEEAMSETQEASTEEVGEVEAEQAEPAEAALVEESAAPAIEMPGPEVSLQDVSSPEDLSSSESETAVAEPVVASEESAASTEAVVAEGEEEEVQEESHETPVSEDESPEPVAEEVYEEPKPLHPDIKWYVVNAYSGYEMKAKRSLEERIRQNELDDLFGAIHVPEEKVVELVRGEKKTSTRKFFPGYMLVQMVLNQDTWHLVKETPKISGFVGDQSDPQPITEEEVARVMDQVEEGISSPRARVSFEQGDTVKVIDGPFTDFNGTIEEVRPEKGKVKVLISIFGRATPVELDFIQVEKC